MIVWQPPAHSLVSVCPAVCIDPGSVYGGAEGPLTIPVLLGFGADAAELLTCVFALRRRF